MFNFTALLGAQSESPASQSLLELDGGVKILVDVGWDISFNPEKLQALEKHVSTLSIVLLTHPTLDHLGAYAHCCKHIPLFSKVPVYATTPVINLGRSLLNDLYASSPLAASIIPSSALAESATESVASFLLSPPTYDEIASFFALINPLKYSQPHQPIPSPFSPSLAGLTITAYGAGHTLGGTIWHIQHGLESIVYAADWNQGRENLLSGAAWLSSTTGGAEIIEPLRRPTALVCSSKGVEKDTSLSRKKRDDTLISLIRETITQGGKVLIPTDSSARVLELAFILNQTWHENLDGPHADTYKNTMIYMASKSSSASVRYLQSMVEWVDDAVRGEAEAAMTKGKGQGRSVGMLDFTHVKQIERGSQLKRALSKSNPCVMLASDASLEWGFSRQVLQALATDPKNLVILTEKTSNIETASDTVGKSLWDAFRGQEGQISSQSGAKVVNVEGMKIDFRTASSEILDSDENALFQGYMARQRQMYSTVQDDSLVDATQTADLADDQASDSSDSEDEDDDAEHQGRALNLSAQLTQSNKRKVGLTDAELGINVLLRGKNVHDYDVRNKRGREKMFPFMAHRNRTDDFGDLIKPEDYLRAEERDDIDGVDMKARPKEVAAVGQKRRWDETAAASKNARILKVPNKRSKNGESSAPDDIDALIARATGQGENGDDGPNGVDGESENGDSDESDYEPEETAPDGPRKIVFTSESLMLNLKIAHVDFSGLHEMRDLQMLIPLIRPRKLILIAGEQSETQKLANECRQLLGDEGEGGATDVFSPLIGEVVDASVDTNAWTLKLSRELVKKLTWQNVKGLGIVALTGSLNVEAIESEKIKEGESAKKKLKLIKSEEPIEGKGVGMVKAAGDVVVMPVLDLLAAQDSTSTAQQHVTQPVHVGDLRLAALRQLVQSAGHTAEFRGEGTLLIDGAVVVRKSGSGRIEVEAGAGGLRLPQYRTKDNEGSFYAVRKLIYEGLAVVAGV
ncbi:cleavage and polyadenylation specificity factor subunit 2 like protein [Acrodontium crateriforme]|uniref:Cleavage and polyadenylation specificity factor subunit 2 n=1 Tax=Acrodontium crateriforme TaxID=150365 RepID=A0AAQ3M3U9_9PEZI|nr:cleavage and polyadenylation specificity factor subunit 2 like protein [Acrodontium crateriforme]